MPPGEFTRRRKMIRKRAPSLAPQGQERSYTPEQRPSVPEMWRRFIDFGDEPDRQG